MNVPAQPPLDHALQNTTLFTLDCKIAPAHIGQGSSVTYNVASSRRQPSLILQASLIARAPHGPLHSVPFPSSYAPSKSLHHLLRLKRQSVLHSIACAFFASSKAKFM